MIYFYYGFLMFLLFVSSPLTVFIPVVVASAFCMVLAHRLRMGFSASISDLRR